MTPVTRVYLYSDAGLRFFGVGPYRLLLEIQTQGSLRRAAQSMDLAYTKALRMIRSAETELGFALTEKSIGGRGGGGSRLTPEAECFLDRFARFQDRCEAANRAIYREIFSEGKELGADDTKDRKSKPNE